MPALDSPKARRNGPGEGGAMGRHFHCVETAHDVDASGAARTAVARRELLVLAALGLVAGPAGLARAAEAKGELTWGVHVSLAPTWFDPGDASGIITPFLV